MQIGGKSKRCMICALLRAARLCLPIGCARPTPPIAALSQVARDRDGILAGAIRYWPVCVGQSPALLLGPIAVHPTRQGEGLGGYLIRESLALAPGSWLEQGAAGGRRALLPKIRISPAQRR
jgi:GNAT superfamily N-acetyltransferase